MRSILGVLLLSAFSANADTFGDWTYSVSNGEATITGYSGSGGELVIPSEVNGIPVKFVGDGGPILGYGNRSVTSIVIPQGVIRLGDNAFTDAHNLLTIIVPNSVTYFGFHLKYNSPAIIINDVILARMATSDAFITAVANKILSTSNNYGLATQSAITSATSNLATQSEIATLATKTELTNSLAQSRVDGINNVLSNPNLWTLYTTNQISAMAIGDLVLTRTNNGSFVLNYDIEQSEDLQTWIPYLSYTLPMTNLPTDKAFVRIKAKQ